MEFNKKVFLRSFRYLCLTFVFVVGIIAIVASGGGGGDGSTGTTDETDTTTTTTTDTTSAYDPISLPTGTSFEYTDDDTNPTTITFGPITITGDTASASDDGKIVTITAPGTYNINGVTTDGQIKVDTLDAGDVRLVLKGVNITCSDGPPIDIENAERVVIRLQTGTNNYLTDSHSSEVLDGDGEIIDAALYSKEDLVICGTGTLTVNTSYKDGIKSKDGLIIDSGTIIINSADDGIIGKNYISIEDGDITVDAGGDGLKSTNDGDTTQGFIYVTDGFIDIAAGADAIQVETHIVIDGGVFELDTDSLTEDDTAKGLKSPVGITINGGIFTINTGDDAIHSNDTIVIEDGDFEIASGDDGFHADTNLEINDGDFTISECYEGIESAVITIAAGNFFINSDDDGLNCAGGADGSGMDGPGGPDDFNQPASGNYYLYIEGGYLAIYSNGDSLDSNGSIEMSGGTVLVHAPSNDNGALDIGSSFNINGGFLVTAGGRGMGESPSDSSTQNFKMLTFSERSAGTLIHIESSSGTDIVTFEPAKKYSVFIISSPDLLDGTTYNVYFGGSYSGGTETDGLYEGGAYSGGTEDSSLSFSL